jgi:uncharacterized protein (TIGR03083 family)
VPLDFDPLRAISDHSSGLATAAAGYLGELVEGCPGWRVADLVRHLTEVHWFWATIVEELLQEPPPESRRPAPAPDGQLLDVFRVGADRLVSVLAAADPKAPCWTWAPAQQDVAFVVRHQVQEAAVHYWDAARAAGAEASIDPPVAADAVEEFLTFSVSSEADPADPPRPALGGRLVLSCSDWDAAWTVQDGAVPGTLVHLRGAGAGAPVLRARASDLLIWLYRRVELPVPDRGLASRLRGLCFTD